MQAAVTTIGQFNGAIAFEYEIRDDLGSVQVADFVVVHPATDETWDDLAGLVGGFLRRRAVKWTLAASPDHLREKRHGRRLAQSVGGSRAEPRIGNVPPQPRHRVSVSVTAEEALLETGIDPNAD